MPAPGWTRRLGVDGKDMVPGLDQRREDHRGKRRGAHVDEVEYLPRRLGGHHVARRTPELGSRESLAALCLGELAQDHPTLDEGQVVNEQDPVEVFDFMLQASGKKPLGVHLADLVFLIQIAHSDLGRAGHIRVVFRQRRQPSLKVANSDERHRISGLASLMGCGFSPSRATSRTITRLDCPTCGAASPMPIAWYIVSSMSSISRRTLASTAGTGRALILSRGSGAVMIES